ncbi:site-specific integrase [Lusitaniella coriacea LEGE 07157]|uniref:Site-specific integrase n=1 Tax=Lusitaniella coriacea LEGE 07157 TaxID=945747 RepID=A0A8J7E0S6_9CYAN|nr:site-specific integrase [Lusitaniella coriacea]MBE9117206.1 site-specific integrase [Lusitaniella coriacea LEGE 07157]
MKIDRHGQAKILTLEELERLFNNGLTNSRDRALFAICLYTACRIRECCTLRTTDVYERKGDVLPEIIFRKGNTKGKLATRAIPVIEELRRMLLDYYPSPRTWFLFPGLAQTGHIHPDSAARIFRRACQRVNIIGASTHSFRRTALTQLSNEGIPLRVIQEVSGHRNLGELQKYLEVKPEQVRGAVSALSMLSTAGKSRYDDTLTGEEEKSEQARSRSSDISP